MFDPTLPLPAGKLPLPLLEKLLTRFAPHDPRVVAHAVRVVTLVDGRVAHDEVTPGEAPHEILPGIGKAPAGAGS